MVTSKRVRTLKVIQALDSGVFAVSLGTDKSHTALGRLNFDQVVAVLEKYFVFNDDSDFKAYDEIWAVIDALKENEGR